MQSTETTYNSNRKRRPTAALLAVAAILLTIIAGGCSRSDDAEPADDATRSIAVSFRVPLDSSADSSQTADGYEEGTPDEALIDVAENCRVLFFTTSNTFLGELQNTNVAEIPGTGFRQYTVIGNPPENLPLDFRIMIAANWPDAGAIDEADPGATTIDDICLSAASQYAASAGFTLDPDAGRLIPFYGIREYRGITPGAATTLAEPVTLLRAVAKIEVVFDCEKADLPRSVELIGHNAAGCCAPSRVYSQADYGQGQDWANDYLRSLHLTTADNHNDPDATSRRLAMNATSDADRTTRYTIYVPEYRNLRDDGSAAADEAYIEIRLPSQSADEVPFRIYFANYSGQTTSSATLKRNNIERNNIYRFNVTLRDGRIIILARPWNYRPQPEINA